jgi:hypothetical protein
MSEKVLIGIDDTDNLESRGTGFRARQLGEQIEFNRLGSVECITRHQLLFDSRIPYTSHNSSACIELVIEDIDKIIAFCRSFMLEIAAVGSDVGLAIAKLDDVDEVVIEWGNRAKKTILTKDEAYSIAEAKGIYLEGLTGTKDGVIGALAGVGLRKGGNDGRCIGLKGKEVRDLSGIYTVSELNDLIKIDRIIDLDGAQVFSNSKIFVGDWLRAVILENKITIFVNSKNIESNYDFKIATKDYIKGVSD